MNTATTLTLRGLLEPLGILEIFEERGVTVSEQKTQQEEAEETQEAQTNWQEWLDSVEIVRVPGLAAWQEALQEAHTVGVCGLDTETTGLDPLQAQVRLVQLAVPVFPEGTRHLVAPEGRGPVPGSGAKVYLLDLFSLSQSERREALEALAGLVGDPGVLKIGHNLKFDLAFLRTALDGRRRPAERLFDTMLASQLVTAGDFVPGGQWDRYCAEHSLRPAQNDRGQELKAKRLDEHGHLVVFEHDNAKNIKPFYPTHSLAQVAHRHLEVWLEKEYQASDWTGELSEEQVRYAALDAAVLLPLQEILTRLLKLNRLVDVARIEFACLPAVVEVELSGMPFDASRARELLAAAREEQARYREALEALAVEAGFTPKPRKGKKNTPGFNPDSSIDALDLLRLLAEKEGLLKGDKLAVGGEEFPLETRDDTLTRLAARVV
jgi:DNA polymerase-1